MGLIVKSAQKSDVRELEYPFADQKQFEKWVRKCQAMKMISEHFTAGEVSIFFHVLIDGHFMWPMILNQKSNLNDHDYTSGKKIITQSFLAAFGMKRD